MSRINLQTSFLDQGIRNINFFNGRILTAQDLQDEQSANRRQHQQLGRAIGAGIVHGLSVSVVNPGVDDATPIIKVHQGLAINGKGHALVLPVDVEVNLLHPDESERHEAGLFAVCTPPQQDVIYTGTGAYVLLMTPASGLLERAPMNALDDDGKASECGFRYAAEGVQFRLLKLAVDELLDGLLGLDSADFVEPAADDVRGWSRLRSALAHLCLGTAERIPFEISFSAPADDLNVDVDYAALARLADDLLNDCDVPLALIYWTDSGIRFVDMWSVRRRAFELTPAITWPTLLNPRFSAEAEAVLLQFHHQIAALHADPVIGENIHAEDFFTHLPAVGHLPVGADGFDWHEFLGAHAPPQQTPLAEGLVRALRDAALLRAPVRVVPRNSAQSATATPYHVYRIGDHDDYVLFVRSGLAEVLAGDVYFDNSVCRLPDSDTVQGALDALCRRIRGCCTMVIAPESGWEQAFERLQPGQDVFICFEAGRFELSQPLRLSGLGHVQVCGAGRGTCLVAAAGESVLTFENCASVRIGQLSAETGAAGAGPPQTSPFRHLNGVLSFTSCAIVDIDAVALRCAAANRRAASCLYIRNSAPTSSRATTSARIRACEFTVGRGQVGVLVINAARSQIDDNILRFAGTPGAAGNTMNQGIVVAGSFAGDVRICNNTLHDVVQGIHVGVSHRETSRGSPDSAERVIITGNTIEVTLSAAATGERHAIFIGSCASLVVQNNHARLQRIGSGSGQSIDGLRLYGSFGRSLLVRGNHFDDFTVGILLNSLTLPPVNPQLQWVVDDNLAVSAAQVVRVLPTALRSRVRGVSNNYA